MSPRIVDVAQFEHEKGKHPGQDMMNFMMKRIFEFFQS